MMLVEVPLAMMAWVGVVLIQAIVHFGMLSRRTSPRCSLQSNEYDTFHLYEEESPPDGLETFLSHTGDDVINIIRSNSYIEHRARKELDREKED